jgi:transcriptional regulator with XRE-family HTH domain
MAMIEKNNLKEIRTQLKVSQLELHRRTRIAPGILSNIENHKMYVYPGWKKRIAKALGIPEKEIFKDVIENETRT